MIEPVMSDRDWRQFLVDDHADQTLPRYFSHCDHANMIAKHNAALPDADPRKITWEMIDKIHDFAFDETQMQIADALASYLPPRAT